jgi:hypothetical protein
MERIGVLGKIGKRVVASALSAPAPAPAPTPVQVVEVPFLLPSVSVEDVTLSTLVDEVVETRVEPTPEPVVVEPVVVEPTPESSSE